MTTDTEDPSVELGPDEDTPSGPPDPKTMVTKRRRGANVVLGPARRPEGEPEPEPAPPEDRRAARRPSRRELFLARNANTIDTEAVEVDVPERGSHDIVNLEVRTARRIILYKPTDYGWSPRPVPSTNLVMLLDNGWSEFCGNCGSYCNTDPNSCAGRPKRKFIRCPIDRKRLYDFNPALVRALLEEAEDFDENELTLEDVQMFSSTPETRLKALLSQHMLAFHPQEAQTFGVTAPSNPRDPRGGYVAPSARQRDASSVERGI